MKNEIIKAEDFGLEEKAGVELTSGLKISLDERKLLVKEFKQVSKLEVSVENLNTFKTLRLKIVKNRTQGITAWHKRSKDFFLTGGRFVDAIKNKEIFVNEQMESKLMDAENHFDNLEKERILKLNAERIELVRPYLEEVDNLSLSGMEQDVFDAYLLTKKNNYEAIVKADKEREEARLKAIEDERLEQERIRLENARLTKEAEEKEKALEVERDIARKKAEDLRKVQAAKDAKIKAEKDKLVAELKAERDAEEERIAKNNAKIIAEKNAEEERTQKELNKGDAAKVKDLLEDLEGLKTKFVFKSGKNKKMYAQVSELMDKVINHIQK